MKYKVVGQIAPHIKTLKDVTVQGNEISFGKSWTKTAAESILTHAINGSEREKVLKVQVTKKELTAENKALILSKIKGKIAERIDEFGVYEYRASTDEKDTDNDIFDKSLLEMWAVDGNGGVPFVFRHDYDEPLGNVYKSTVLWNSEKNRWELMADVFVLPDAEVGSLKAVDCIDAGIYKNCSVRVRTGTPKVIEGENWYDTSYVYSANPDAKWLELSLVPYGANKSANQTKEERAKFILIEDMEKLFVELIHLKGEKTEITAEFVKAMSNELHSYKEKDAAIRTEKENLFTNKSLIVTPDANKSHLEVLAKALPILDLEKEIQLLTEKEAAMKNGLTPENKTAGETTLKANSNPANSFQ
jgi:hypothetical protein